MTRNDRKARNSNPGAGGPADSLRIALAQRVVVADGAMGTMLQASPATLSDFDGHEGCNEVLNITRPDIVRAVHDAGLVIHEARFTYPDYDLTALVDLGAWWEANTGLPIPLGAILVRRELDAARLADVVRARLKMDRQTLPLARILQGGTWTAGHGLKLREAGNRSE